MLRSLFFALLVLSLFHVESLAQTSQKMTKKTATPSKKMKKHAHKKMKKHARKKMKKHARKKAKKGTKRHKKKRLVPTFQSVTVGRRAPQDPFRSTRSLSVLSRKQLEERRPRTTPEALMEVPGVFVQKTNHGGGAPIIRGGVGPQILLLIDGVRLNTSTFRSGPNQYLNLIDPWSIRQLEVLRGAGSLAYGSYAFGGVLNVRTQNPLMSFGSGARGNVTAAGRFASADSERSGHLSMSGSMGNVGVRAGVTYGVFSDLRPGHLSFNSRTKYVQLPKKSFFYYRDTFGDLVINPETGGQIFSAYKNLFVDGKLKWKIGGGWTLIALYQRAMILDAGRADQLGAKGSYRIYNNTRDFGYIRLKGSFPALRTHLRFTVSGQWLTERVRRERFSVSNNYAFSRRSDNSDDVAVIGVGVDGETKLSSRLQLSYGLDMYHDRVFSSAVSQRAGQETKKSRGNFPEGGQYTTFGGYIVGNFRALSWKKEGGLFVHGGIRLNGFLAHANARENLDAVNFQQFGYAPFGSLQMLIERKWNISLSYNQGFRAPNLQESAFLGDAGNAFELPNPNLKPEISHTVEMTIRTRLNRRFTGFVTGYYSIWSDLITKADGEYKGQKKVDGKSVKQRINTANASVMGLEMGLGAKIWRGLTWSGSLTWTRGVAIADGGTETPLSRIPPVFGRTSLRYAFQGVGFVEVYSLFAGAQTALSKRDKGDPRIPTKDPNVPERVFDGTPGWITLNIRGGVRFPRMFGLSQAFRAYFSVENLFDVRYKYHGSGVYAPGLNVRLTLEISI